MRCDPWDGKKLTEPGVDRDVTTPEKTLPACCPTGSGGSGWLQKKNVRRCYVLPRAGE